MALPRLSLRGSILIVCLLGVNFATARGLFSRNPVLLIGLALHSLVLEVLVIRLVRQRGRLGPFWIGFLAAGSVVLMSYVWAEAVPPVTMIDRVTDPWTGRIAMVGRLPASARIGVIWRRYDRLAWQTFERWPAAAAWIEEQSENDRRALFPVDAAVKLVPQIVLAIAGGLLAWGVSRLMTSRVVCLSQTP